MLSRSVGRVERFVFGGTSHEMYPQRGQRNSSSTRFLILPVFSGFRRVWHCGHRTARNSSTSLLPKCAPILNRTNNNTTMKTHTQLKMRKGIFKLAPSVKQRYRSDNGLGISSALHPFPVTGGDPCCNAACILQKLNSR